MGRLIPAGTGLGHYTRAEVLSQGGEDPVAVAVPAEEEPVIVDGDADEIAQAG